MRAPSMMIFTVILLSTAQVYAQEGTIPNSPGPAVIHNQPVTIPQPSSQSIAKPTVSIPQAQSNTIFHPPINPSDISPNNPNSLSQDNNNPNLPCGPNVPQPCIDQTDLNGTTSQ